MCESDSWFVGYCRWICVRSWTVYGQVQYRFELKNNNIYRSCGVWMCVCSLWRTVSRNPVHIIVFRMVIYEECGLIDLRIWWCIRNVCASGSVCLFVCLLVPFFISKKFIIQRFDPNFINGLKYFGLWLSTKPSLIWLVFRLKLILS